MRLVTIKHRDAELLGVLKGDEILAGPSLPHDMIEAIHVGHEELQRRAERAVSDATLRVPVAEATFRPPIPRPGKILCLGLNYFEHALEGGLKNRPEHPIVFMRAATSLTAHEQPIRYPATSTALDYEAELVAIVGRRTRHATPATALDAVFGYSIFNDASVRDYQRRTPQWTFGKNFDGTGAFGPAIVTADELPPGASGLGIRMRLNGTVMQSANTSEMIFDVAETVIRLSEIMTLEPGDVLVMGTPGGIGAARTPPVWMKPGDRCEVEIDGLGVLRNTIGHPDRAQGEPPAAGGGRGPSV